MKRVSKVLLGAAGVAAMVVSAASSAGIANTRHNLGTTGGTSLGGGATDNHLTQGTGEICVFCHTPHASDTSAPVPLWNRVLGADANGVKGGFSTYDMLNTSTLNGVIAGGAGKVGSVSLACLSCHDGSMAMDNVINQPGSGGYNAAGAPMTNAKWTGDRQLSGKMINANGFVSMLGVDLKNDHPVGIQYGGGCKTQADYNTGDCVSGYKDKDFVKASYDTAKKVWWVDTSVGAANQREVTDMILYSRVQSTGAGTALAGQYVEPFVECASCHDPHVESKDYTTQVQFLRVSQSGSGVCLACHVK